MTGAGWTMMVLSVGFVLGLAAFCFYRVLTTPRTEEEMRGAMDIEPWRKASTSAYAVIPGPCPTLTSFSDA